jgi:hypothetical protein
MAPPSDNFGVDVIFEAQEVAELGLVGGLARRLRLLPSSDTVDLRIITSVARARDYVVARQRAREAETRGALTSSAPGARPRGTSLHVNE